jgi:acetyl esterase
VAYRSEFTTQRIVQGAAGLLWLHGGGFTTGSLDTHDTLCRRLAVLSTQAGHIRRLPAGARNPYPAALQDSYDVLGWIMANAASLSLTRCAAPSAVAAQAGIWLLQHH